MSCLTSRIVTQCGSLMSKKIHTTEDTTILRTTIGPRIKKARLAMRLTQGAAATRVGISAEFFARLERGHALPSVTTIKKIADTLGVTVDYLFGMDGVFDSPNPPLSPIVKSKDPKAIRFIVGKVRHDPDLRRLVNSVLKVAARKTGVPIDDEDDD